MCILLGENSKHDCEETIEGTAADVNAALQKFIPLIAWKLSMVGLDNQGPPIRARQRVCLLLITGCSKEAITVHNVTRIDEGAVAEAEYFMKKMRTLGMRAELQQSGEHKRMNEWSKTPDSAKKRRVLEVHPSGESLS